MTGRSRDISVSLRFGLLLFQLKVGKDKLRTRMTARTPAKLRRIGDINVLSFGCVSAVTECPLWKFIGTATFAAPAAR